MTLSPRVDYRHSLFLASVESSKMFDFSSQLELDSKTILMKHVAIVCSHMTDAFFSIHNLRSEVRQVSLITGFLKVQYLFLACTSLRIVRMAEIGQGTRIKQNTGLFKACYILGSWYLRRISGIMRSSEPSAKFQPNIAFSLVSLDPFLISLCILTSQAFCHLLDSATPFTILFSASSRWKCSFRMQLGEHCVDGAWAYSSENNYGLFEH